MTTSTAHLFCAEDPQRPADWRWARAQWLTSQRSRYARQKDEEDVVLVARSYQKLLANCRSDTDHDALRRKYPGIYWAHRIHETSSGVRWALEAWLLTGASPSLIVQRNRVTPETLTWYEKLFFSVTDSLACPDYILNVVIGSAVHRGVNDRDYDLLWKLFGFLGGVDVLDSMITQKANPRAEAWFGDHTRFTIRRKAAIAAHTMPVAFHHQVILETYTKVAELERLHGNTEESHNLMVKQLHLAMAAVDSVITVGDRSPTGPEALLVHEKDAVELRASELLQISSGQTPDIPDLSGFTFGGTGDTATHH